MQNLPGQIAAEIKRVQSDLRQQKKIIKINSGDARVVEPATLQMKALLTRLKVLEDNLAKEMERS